MTIDANGNVGIGTTSPTAKLTIGGLGIGNIGGLKIEESSSAADGAHFSYNDASRYVVFGGITNNVLNDAVAIERDATRTITIDSLQRVGIGATSPSSELDVYGTISLNGFDALRYNTTSQGLYAGHLAGNNQTNTNAFGYSALQNNTGTYSNGFGNYALRDNTGDFSSGFGYEALRNNTGANSNGFGLYVLRDNTGVNSNGFGRAALRYNTGDSSNGFGYAALQNNTGGYSSGVGHVALQNNQGTNNTAIGGYAGYETTALTGGSNTFLGYNASYGANTTITNSTAVGADVTLTDSNTVILGNGANVGIGTTSPSEKLEVDGTIKATDYKGYLSAFQHGGFQHTASTSSTTVYWIPTSNNSEVISSQSYNNWVAPYDGRVKKIVMRWTSNGTPTATSVIFRKAINGTTDATEYPATVTSPATTDMIVERDFSSTDISFQAGDRVQLGFTTDGGTRLLQGFAYTIVLEYNKI
jgi:hypothetical protein